jgi:CDP-glycerol glycerophosphotransferase (TagB/SpsB family)
MRPHFYEDPAVVAEAKRLGISVLAFITSWDNLSTKNRMLFRYDAFLVWSERMKEELHYFYPYSRSVPVYVVGAPQFDVFFQNRFRMSRDEFCAQQSLQGSLPIVVYALGSPNFLPGEWYAAYYLAKKVAEGELGNAQLIVRPHPLFDSEDLHQKFRAFGPRVVVQRTGQTDLPSNARFQNEEQIREWVNTFRHADVVVNFASTATIDAAILDKPVVNLDFDPEPAQTRQSLVKDVNHAWTHFRPIADSGGIWLVNSLDEMLEAVSTYLRHPELHCEKRQWIARYVAGYLDGLCGERMARAVLDFARSNLKKRFKKTHSIS